MYLNSNKGREERPWAALLSRAPGPPVPPAGCGRKRSHSLRSYVKFLLIGPLLLISRHPLQAQNQPVQTNKTAQEGLETGMIVPADTRIPLRLQNAISSKTAYVGQAIYCRTVYPITVGDRIAIPVGSYVQGSITQVIHPGRIRGKAKLGLHFDSITLPNGATRPLRATLSAFAGNGKEGFDRKESKIQGASTKGKDAGRIARATIVGAEIGSIAGISRGRSLKGLGVGSAAGAAGGIIWVLAGRGRQIFLPQGTSLELQLAAPLNFRRNDD